MKARKSVFILMILFMATAVSASFGSYVSNTQKTVDGNQASFSINLFNLGEENLEIKIESDIPEGTQIYHPNSYQLAPSKVTKDPSSSQTDWFYLGEGEYVKTVQVPVDFQVDTIQDKEKYKFDVNIKSSPSQDSELEESKFYNIQQERVYSFEVETTGGETQNSNNNAFTVSNSNQNQRNVSRSQAIVDQATGIINRINPLTEDDRNQADDSISDSGPNKNKDNNQGNPKDNVDDKTSINSTSNQKDSKSSEEGLTGQFVGSGSSITIFLLIGISTMTIYLIKVM